MEGEKVQPLQRSRVRCESCGEPLLPWKEWMSVLIWRTAGSSWLWNHAAWWHVRGQTGPSAMQHCWAPFPLQLVHPQPLPWPSPGAREATDRNCKCKSSFQPCTKGGALATVCLLYKVEEFKLLGDLLNIWQSCPLKLFHLIIGLLLERLLLFGRVHNGFSKCVIR